MEAVRVWAQLFAGLIGILLTFSSSNLLLILLYYRGIFLLCLKSHRLSIKQVVLTGNNISNYNYNYKDWYWNKWGWSFVGCFINSFSVVSVVKTGKKAMLSLHPLLHNFSENMLALIKGTDTFKGIYFDGVDNLEAVPSCHSCNCCKWHSTDKSALLYQQINKW